MVADPGEQDAVLAHAAEGLAAGAGLQAAGDAGGRDRTVIAVWR